MLRIAVSKVFELVSFYKKENLSPLSVATFNFPNVNDKINIIIF